MSKTIAGAIASFFGRSGIAISEKLSTEEFNQFAEDAAELDAKLNDPATSQLAADLKAANDKVAELKGQLTEAATAQTKLNEQIATLTGERDKYKAQHERAAEAGTGTPKEDANSRGKSEMASYNAHALEVYNKANGK
ncbi:hypothetical protein [Dyadobacter sp. 22481]|uniref:hypothetical protein n=1 Tax=Dyadobacter sp. 22481 TaxID=3453926 RepID=UPI003F87F7F0